MCSLDDGAAAEAAADRSSVDGGPLAADIPGVLRQVNMGVDVIDPIDRDQVVFAVFRVGLRQLDAGGTVEMIDRPHMGAVGSPHFHMFSDLVCGNHRFLLCVIATKRQRRGADMVPMRLAAAGIMLAGINLATQENPAAAQ